MKITIYIPVHNYGKYVEKAIRSVMSQTMNDWELIIINDGSTDNTAEILKKYAENPKIRIIEQEKKGLNISNNIALRLSNAKYFMRLDADDYLDENALAILSNVLDAKPEIGLVYSDYYLVDEYGEIIEVVRRKKIGEEVELLDIPPQGACTMFRKESLLELGGYAEEFDCQDGYDIWLKFLQSFKPYNVNVPLFYYRQHPHSLTRNQAKILETRRNIKRSFVKKFKNNKIPEVLAIVPAIRQSSSCPDSPFAKLSSKPLIWYTLKEALKTKMLKKIVVTSDDERLLRYTARFKKVIVIKRPKRLTTVYTGIRSIIMHTLETLKKRGLKYPDAVMVLYLNTPLRKAAHIEKAIDTMTIFGLETVVSVAEELAYCYFHDRNGLVPIRKSREIRIEKKALFKETGAILLSRVDVIKKGKVYGKRIGHITMLPEESIKIKSPFELWLTEKILSDWL